MSNIPENFEISSGKSNYLRLNPGKHRVRVLGNGLVGYEWWEETPEGGRTPHRIPMNGRPPAEYAETTKPFIAFPVWNYNEKRVQIWEASQMSIMRELKALETDPDWGALENYDLEIERTGNDKNTTRYRLTPKPKAELTKEVQKIVDGGLPVLEALFENKDPFSFNPLAKEEEQPELF